MGLFDKLKSKISGAAQSVSDAVQNAAQKTVEAVQTAVTATTDALRFEKIKDGLEKTRVNFIDKLQVTLGIGRKVDDALLMKSKRF